MIPGRKPAANRQIFDRSTVEAQIPAVYFMAKRSCALDNYIQE